MKNHVELLVWSLDENIINLDGDRPPNHEEQQMINMVECEAEECSNYYCIACLDARVGGTCDTLSEVVSIIDKICNDVGQSLFMPSCSDELWKELGPILGEPRLQTQYLH